MLIDKIVKKNKATLKNRLGTGKNPKLLVHTISLLQESTDQVVNDRIGSGEVKFDCKKGCSTCCSMKVEILPPEAFRIANYVKSLPELQQQEIVQKLREQANYSRVTWYTIYSKPCTFLDQEGACSIYSIRPHNCRAYLSKSLPACQQKRFAEQDSMLKSASERLKNDAIEIFTSKKCVMVGAELGESVLLAFENENLQEQWANGEQVFPPILERREPNHQPKK
jgi:uncharacterized protein